MNNLNLLTQYPLSSKKFWKKIIEKSIICGVFSIAISVMLGLALFAASDPGNISVVGIVVKAVIVGLVFFAVVMSLYSWYVKYYIKTYFYEHSEDFLTIKKGVFMPAEIHVQYLKMQDVYVDQDILDRILGIYDVHISSATFTSGMAAHIDGVDKAAADGLKTLFLNTIKERTFGPRHTEGSSSMTSTPDVSEAKASNQRINLSEEISSEHGRYMLSEAWWMGEWVKIALGSVITPALVTFWFLSGSKNGVRMDIALWVWLAILVVYIVGAVVKLLLWKKNYSYKFTDQYIYMKEGVISISEKNMPYNSIQDVKVNQGIVDRIFGVADVFIENAAGGTFGNLSGSSFGRNSKNTVSTGIVIEGLSVEDARHLAGILKEIIINKPQMRGI